jgi:hypothetical protein
MAGVATVHAWMVAHALRRAAGPAEGKANQPYRSAVPSTRLGLSHPQTHPATTPTI